jgi:Protein of unknown function (DUF3089)
MGRVRWVILAALGACAVVVAVPSTASAKTVWLCKPGLEDNPCKVPLDTTFLTPSGVKTGAEGKAGHLRRKVDCFYVYPTVSDQPGPQANLEIDPVLRSIALYQAARYSERCRVFAPVYRQLTLTGIPGGATSEMREIAYQDVLDAWNTYLEKYNRGRGVTLIGHSQGAFVLTRLVQEEIDPRRKARKRLVSAFLLGGNVTVADGQDTGGSFERIKACRSRRQLGCVVAFSTFGGPVPDDAVFGRTVAGQDVLCNNPAALRGGSAPLDTIQPSEPFAPGTIAAAIHAAGLSIPPVSTRWIEYRDAFWGECSSAEDANVLQITGAPGAPELNPVPPSFGLHLVDGNIALGDLVDLLGKQASTYVKKRG